MKRKKGTGYLYQPKQRDGSLSRVWMCQYYTADGRRVRESTRTESEAEARKFLNARLGQIAQGQPVLPKADQTRYEEAAQDLRTHYAVTGSRDLKEAEGRLAHLHRFFSHRKIASIGPADVEKFQTARQQAGASNATVNRDVAVLRRMLRLAHARGKLHRLPDFGKRLKEAAPRSGFFEAEQFEAVRRHLRPDLQVAVTIDHTFGWRTQSEVLTLERRNLDLDAGTLRIDPGRTKNDDGRVAYLNSRAKDAPRGSGGPCEGLGETDGQDHPVPVPASWAGR